MRKEGYARFPLMISRQQLPVICKSNISLLAVFRFDLSYGGDFSGVDSGVRWGLVHNLPGWALVTTPQEPMGMATICFRARSWDDRFRRVQRWLSRSDLHRVRSGPRLSSGRSWCVCLCRGSFPGG